MPAEEVAIAAEVGVQETPRMQNSLCPARAV
jgi:hypothetical protein